MKSESAISLLEILLVMTIIALLAVIGLPRVQEFMERAQSVVCMNNLRQLGTMVENYINDNDGKYPQVETNPTDPVYQGQNVPDMAQVFGPYGLTTNTIRCPTDMSPSGSHYFTQWGSSYEWKPMLDDESQADPKIYSRRGVYVINPRRLRLVFDFDTIHLGRKNALYADGHVALPAM